MHDTISSTLETLERLTAEDFASLNNDDLHDAVVRLDLARERAEQVMLERWRALQGDRLRVRTRLAATSPNR
ncbi:MAG: hypothetical protein WD397_05615 [Wenzhouxiangellaceae bacterium]